MLNDLRCISQQHFSCRLPLRTSDEVYAALAYHRELVHTSIRNPAQTAGFEVADGTTAEGPGLWLYSTRNAILDDLVDYVFALAEQWALHGVLVIRWAITSTAPQPDGFLGGAAVLDLERCERHQLETDEWINDTVARVKREQRGL